VRTLAGGHEKTLQPVKAPDIERCLRLTVEIPVMLLVLAEVLILFVGICARLFHRPIVWSDELASILFLWLAMLGAVVALQRGEHMRLTYFVSHFSPRVQAWCETLAVGTAFVMLTCLLHPAYDYTEDQSFVEMPALGWSGAVRALAIPVGFVLAFLSCGLRLVRRGLTDIASVVLVLAGLAVALHAAAPFLAAIGNWTLIVFFVGLLGAGVLSGVPIAFAFTIATVAYLLTVTSTPLTVVIGRMDEGMSGLILLAIPLFVLLGQLVEATGMARVMVEFLASLLGHVKAGMSYVLLGAMLLVSGISGSKTADMAAVAPVLFPEMRRRGMKDGDQYVLIAIASVTGVSIAALFTAGILPALVLALVLAVLARYRAGREANQVAVPRARASVVVKSLAIAFPALLLPFVIRSAVVEGIATATEVSTIGIAYSLLLGLFIYRGGLTWEGAMPMLVRTASLSGAILFIVGAASGMAWALTQSGFSHALAAAMAGVPGGQIGFLLISLVAFIVLGSLLEGIPAIVLFGPLLFPIARQFGIREVHYSIVVVLAMGLGLFAPPFGLCYYAACIIGGVAPEAGMRRIWIYLGALFVGLLVLTFIPWLSVGLL
jgi:TRAP-type C4-dicarboxylate transport system permease large subunit/TRAP-type C4-dicarboxylate transport system permease small subunit